MTQLARENDMSLEKLLEKPCERTFFNRVQEILNHDKKDFKNKPLPSYRIEGKEN